MAKPGVAEAMLHSARPLRGPAPETLVVYELRDAACEDLVKRSGLVYQSLSLRHLPSRCRSVRGRASSNQISTAPNLIHAHEKLVCMNQRRRVDPRLAGLGRQHSRPRQRPVTTVRRPWCNMRFASTTRVLAKPVLRYLETCKY